MEEAHLLLRDIAQDRVLSRASLRPSARKPARARLPVSDRAVCWFDTDVVSLDCIRQLRGDELAWHFKGMSK